MKNFEDVKRYLLCIFLASLILAAMPVHAMEVAITFDDLPANGNLPANHSRMALTQKILTVLRKHHVEGVYGLINGGKLDEMPEGVQILHEWIKAGHLLGNHTLSHLDLAKTDIKSYLSDIQKNDRVLEAMAQQDFHYFRYPYLSEGDTQEKRDAVRGYLFSHQYKIAPVTVDFFEYEWNEPWVRCTNKQDVAATKWLKQSYLEQANNALIIAHELSQQLFQREIRHVLLLHINAMTAEMLDELLTAYERQHVKFISLPEALIDEAYQLNPDVVKVRAYTFLNQVRLARNLPNPPLVNQLYASLPEEKLAHLCE